MNKKIVLFGMFVLLVCVGLSGCFENNNQSSVENRFVGTWIDNSSSIESTIDFFSDGEYISNDPWLGNGYYEVKGGKLVMTVTTAGANLKYSFDYFFSDNYRSLNMTRSAGGLKFNYEYKKQ